MFYSPTPTNLAYQLLRLKVTEGGVLEPTLRTGLTPRSLAKVNMDIVKRMVSLTEEVPSEATPEMGEGKDEVDEEDIDFQCGRRDFEVFQSTSYIGMSSPTHAELQHCLGRGSMVWW